MARVLVHFTMPMPGLTILVRFSLSSDTDQICQLLRICQQCLAGAVVDDPAAVQNHAAACELQGETCVLFDQHNRRTVVVTQAAQRGEQRIDNDGCKTFERFVQQES